MRPYYQDPYREAFQWLISSRPALQMLTQDVIDTLRALHCADTLRQRGTVLETSGGYEIFVNQYSGRAVFALRLGDSQLYLLELEDAMSAGEAIIASSELDPAGDLRISFTRGAFSEPGATSWAVRSAAIVVHDIQRDVSESFQRPETIGLKASGDMKVLLEEIDDDPDFAERVRTQLSALDPAAVPLYAAALDGFTEDPAGKLRSRLPFLRLSAWLLAHPTVLLGEASGNQ